MNTPLPPLPTASCSADGFSEEGTFSAGLAQLLLSLRLAAASVLLGQRNPPRLPHAGAATLGPVNDRDLRILPVVQNLPLYPLPRTAL